MLNFVSIITICFTLIKDADQSTLIEKELTSEVSVIEVLYLYMYYILTKTSGH